MDASGENMVMEAVDLPRWSARVVLTRRGEVADLTTKNASVFESYSPSDRDGQRGVS